MQLLATVSMEFGEHRGQAIIPGQVEAIPNTNAAGQPHKVPHIGWTGLTFPRGSSGWAGTSLSNVAPGAAVHWCTHLPCSLQVMHTALRTVTTTGAPLRLPSKKTMCAAPSSTRKRAARWGLQLCADFSRREDTCLCAGTRQLKADSAQEFAATGQQTIDRLAG